MILTSQPFGRMLLIRAIIVMLVLLECCAVPADEENPSADAAGPAQQLQELQRRHYCLQLSLAYREWLAGNPTRACQLLNNTPAEQRGWAFGYLSHQFHPELQTITALEQNQGATRLGVRHIEFSPDGNQLAAACDDLHVKIWDFPSAKKQLDFHRETQTISYSPDGQRLAAGLSTSVMLIDPATGDIAYSPSGNLLISGGSDRWESWAQTRIWDADSGVRVLEFNSAVPGTIVQVALIQPHHDLLTLDSHGVVRIYSRHSPSPEMRFGRAAIQLVSDLAGITRRQRFLRHHSPIDPARLRRKLEKLKLHDQVRSQAMQIIEQLP